MSSDTTQLKDPGPVEVANHVSLGKQVPVIGILSIQCGY
jgi:hypothetical protein